MAIAFNALASLTSSTDTTSYATASVTPAPNALVLVFVNSIRSGAIPSVPTVTGNGLTYVEVASVTFNTLAAARSRLTLFRAMGVLPTAGVITAGFGAETQLGVLISAFEFTGTDLTGTNGSGAVIQSATGRLDQVARISVFDPVNTMPYVNSALNALIFGVGKDSTATVTPAFAWTEIHEISHSSPNQMLETQYYISPDIADGATWTGNDDCGAIFAEIKAPYTTYRAFRSDQGSKLDTDGVHVDIHTDPITGLVLEAKAENHAGTSGLGATTHALHVDGTAAANQDDTITTAADGQYFDYAALTMLESDLTVTVV